MARRKVRDEAEAVALIEEAERRGVKPSVVARECGVDGRSANAWALALAKRRRRERSSIMELVPVSSATSTPSMYRISVGDLTVDVDDTFDTHTLRRLMTVLRAC